MIKVLVIDDSLFMRTLIRDLLNSDPEIEVIDTAKDGSEAVKKIHALKPDCITPDLVMPGWDGLTTLKHIMDESPIPVVILSAHSRKDTDITIECLNAGAVGFVLKPSGELSLDIENIKRELLEEVKAASKANIPRLKSLVIKKLKKPKRKPIGVNRIIVIGASTGGPQTLEVLLSSLPTNFPSPIIVVQHMPTRFFTESLAEHLNKISELAVKVAENNEVLQEGTVYLAPSGSQLTLKKSSPQMPSSGNRKLGERYKIQDTDSTIHLSQDKSEVLSPSIDNTMKSVAKIYNGNTIGIILSGMGRDGQEGMKTIKESGGKTIVQDESSLIFGMPKAVIDEGCADKILPVSGVASAMTELSFEQ